MQVAERVYSLAQEQDDPTLMIWAHNALAATRYFLGDFESARKYAISGIQIWRSQGTQSHPEDVDTPVVGCLCYKAFSEWHLGEAPLAAKAGGGDLIGKGAEGYARISRGVRLGNGSRGN